MIVKNLIYILQSENYYFFRFLKFAYSHLAWWSLEERQKLAWTAKAKLIYVLSLLIFLSIPILFFLIFGFSGALIIFILIPISPFIIGLALLLIKPVDIALKQRAVSQAKSILEQSKIIVIGIAGSYGKTSAKEILGAILGKYKIIKTPGNVNTDIGIADFVIKNFSKIREADIFIIEMGAYRVGEIARICNMVRPVYSILTGINEAHLERFGSLKNIITGKFELPERTERMAVLNFDDENIKNNYNKFNISRLIGTARKEASDIKIRKNFLGLEFKFKNIDFTTSLLAEHNITLILLCLKIAQELGLGLGEISSQVAKIKPIDHRLEPIYNSATGIMVIDDSYNGNLAGVVSGLEVLNRAKARKIVLTPGLAELGKERKKIHNRIGSWYARKTDLVLLIKNSVSDYIIEGMKSNGFNNYKIYDSALAAHDDLGNILKKGDTIIFQNDWPDVYY